MCTNIVCRWRINEIFTSLYSLVQLMYYLFGFSNSCQTFEVHAVVNIKITVFRDVTSYSLVHLPHYMVLYLPLWAVYSLVLYYVNYTMMAFICSQEGETNTLKSVIWNLKIHNK